MVARVGGEHRRARTPRRERLYFGEQQLLLRASAMRLRDDDDLMFRIDGLYARVALDDALVGRHFRALVVRAIAFTEPTRRATAILRMRREPLAQLMRILRESRDPRRGLGRDIGLELQRIGLPVPLQHGLRRLL